ncbi:MAG: FHA domain-containing protein [Ectothiorhodospiraceae bacterium]|nr:FHA domain-containing protein [Ectothiorhodospiraceae bacterium]
MTMEQQELRSTQPGIGSGELLGESVGQFEARLASRTRVPVDRLGELMDMADDELRGEARSTARTLRRFAEAVASAMENPASTASFLRDLDLESVSRDHDWRAVFAELRAGGAQGTGHRRTALVRYLQYLGFRKRLIEFVLSRRRALEDTDEYTEIDLGAVRRQGREGGDGGSDAFVRTPLGEGVRVSVGPGEQIDLMLAAHLYRLVGGDPPALVDQNGVVCFIRPGRSLVGRHPEADLRVDENFRDISRAHAIIEWDGMAVTVTDLSTRGTYVRRPRDDS